MSSDIVCFAHSVNTLFTGANTIYEVSIKHSIIDLIDIPLMILTQYPLLSSFFTPKYNQKSEINTHLNVLAISVSTDYDSAKKFGEVLTKMKDTYGGDSWHYTSPSGVNPDLHHAILGKDLGGGVAYGAVLCNPNHGFGVSAGLKGNFVDMGNPVIWDIMVVRSMR